MSESESGEISKVHAHKHQQFAKTTPDPAQLKPILIWQQPPDQAPESPKYCTIKYIPVTKRKKNKPNITILIVHASFSKINYDDRRNQKQTSLTHI